jgi:hypothetical protein
MLPTEVVRMAALRRWFGGGGLRRHLGVLAVIIAVALTAALFTPLGAQKVMAAAGIAYIAYVGLHLMLGGEHA